MTATMARASASWRRWARRSCVNSANVSSGTFASWIHAGYPDSPLDPDEIESFWTDHGFTIIRLGSCWRFDNRDDLERVVHLEFPADKAARFVADHPSNEIEYNLLLIHRTFG